MSEKNIQLVHKRNKLLLSFLLIGMCIDVVANILWQSSWVLTLGVLVTGLALYSLGMFLVKKEKYPVLVMYLILTLFWVFITFMSYIDYDIINLLFLFVVPVASSIYPSWKVSVYTAIISASSFVYFALMGGKALMGEAFEPGDVIFYIGTFSLIGVLSYMQQRFNEKLREGAERNILLANKAKEEALSLVFQMKESQEALGSFSENLNKKTTSAGADSVTVAANFAQMKEAMNQEIYSVENLAENLISVKKETDKIKESSGLMKEKSDLSNETIKKSEAVVENLKNDMQNLGKTFEETFEVNSDLNKKTEEIHTIVEVMENITRQINLLSLNASIEAARSGEAGRGFAVVAEEIKKLAGESKDSTGEIRGILKDIQLKTKASIDKVNQNKMAVTESKESVQEVSEAFSVITDNNAKVVKEINEVNEKVSVLQNSVFFMEDAVSNLSSVSEENSASLNELSSNFENVNDTLKEINKEFTKLKESLKTRE